MQAKDKIQHVKSHVTNEEKPTAWKTYDNISIGCIEEEPKLHSKKRSVDFT